MASYEYRVWVREESGTVCEIAPSALTGQPTKRWTAKTAVRYCFEKKQNAGSVIHIDRRRAGTKGSHLSYIAYRVPADGVPRLINLALEVRQPVLAYLAEEAEPPHLPD
jgi:hypothetical protein